jgi:FolB domain-containing protein
MHRDEPMDLIIINDLHARCIIGVWPDERLEKQDVLINVTVGTDISKAAKTDRLADALDYRALKKRILRFVEKSSFRLVESLVEAIAALCLKSPKIAKIKVRVEKPSALTFARSVGVEIIRSKRIGRGHGVR